MKDLGTILKIKTLRMAFTKGRRENKMTLDYIGNSIGVNKSSLSKFERGKDPDVHTYIKLVEWVEDSAMSHYSTTVRRYAMSRKKTAHLIFFGEKIHLYYVSEGVYAVCLEGKKSFIVDFKKRKIARVRIGVNGEIYGPTI